MELRHLRYFVAVAEELHFGRAAARLNIAQPPLSQQIRQLEDELGFPLFYRDKHHVELTEAGKIFFEEARYTLAHIEESRLAAEQAHRGATGRLHIGFVGSTTYNIVALLQEFRLRFPSVNLVLHQMKMETQLQALHEKRLHIGIGRNPVQGPTLTSERVMQERLVAAIPESNPLASREKLSIRDFEGEPFILTSRRNGSSYHDSVVSLCHQAGFSAKVALEVPEILTIVAFVSAGMGVALVPESFRNQQNQGVVYRDLQEIPATLETIFVWRKDDRSPVLQEFLTLCKKAKDGFRE